MPSLEFRMGINTGPVVAGVIGSTRLQYDVWGDTVNVASRLESHGSPGKIQIGPTTYAAIRDRFRCTHRGTIDIKGKAPVDAWFIDGRA
jgi:class 3 adenylate cyclase